MSFWNVFDLKEIKLSFSYISIASLDIENTVASKINLSKILPESVLESTLHNNKKEYIKRKGFSPPVY